MKNIPFLLIIFVQSPNHTWQSTIGNPKVGMFTFYMGAKNTVQPVVPIRPSFAQAAWRLLDPQGQV